jgi:hypothetical protein
MLIPAAFKLDRLRQVVGSGWKYKDEQDAGSAVNLCSSIWNPVSDRNIASVGYFAVELR